jgi:hypothetical protein
LPRDPIYGGSQYRITLSSEADELASKFVGPKKQYKSVSRFVNDAIVRAFGNEQTRREHEQRETMSKMEATLAKVDKLRKGKVNVEARLRVLSTFYKKPLDVDPVVLAELAQEDWVKHFQKCDACPGDISSRCPSRDEPVACWRVDRTIARFETREEILHQLIVGGELRDLLKKVSALREETKRRAKKEETKSNPSVAELRFFER